MDEDESSVLGRDRSVPSILKSRTHTPIPSLVPLHMLLDLQSAEWVLFSMETGKGVSRHKGVSSDEETLPDLFHYVIM